MKRVLLSSCMSLALLLGSGSAVGQTVPQVSVNTKAETFDFAHESSDLKADPNITYGKLRNGIRYAVMHNDTPSQTAALRVRFATGSLNETDEQQGLAHFLEHMAFNGSENIPEGDLVKRLERYGLRFGADTNAHTSFDETVYKLNLPQVSEEILDEAFMIMRETAENMTLNDDAIDRERGVIRSEKRTRDNAKYRANLAQYEFFTEGSRLMDRFPIGTDKTISSMKGELFEAYYRDFYRPKNTFILLVGDIDRQAGVEKIEDYFGDWEPEGELGLVQDAGVAEIKPGRTGYYSDPEIMTQITIANARPFEKKLDSASQRKTDYIETLGARIVNRRLRTLSKRSDANFLSGGALTSDLSETVEVSQIRMRSEPDQWPEALAVAEQELRRAIEFGFKDAELREQIARSRLAYKAMADAADTRPTTGRFGSGLATKVLNAYGQERVFTHPSTSLKRFEAYADDITTEEVWKAFKKQWQNVESPLLYLETSETIDDPESAIRQAYNKSRKVEVTPPKDRNVEAFAYTEFGDPGSVVRETYVEDIDAHLIKFENNVTLNFKQTDFEKDRVQIIVRVGDGSFSAPRKDEALRRLAYNVMYNGGYEAHSKDEVESIMAGKAAQPNFSIDIEGDAFELKSTTLPADFRTQLNLFAGNIIAPGYREQAKDTYLRSLAAWYPTHDATATGVIAKELPKFLRSGDERFGFPDMEKFLEPTIDEVKNWIGPQLEDGMIDITVVGDIDKDTVVQAVSETLAALPERKTNHAEYPDMMKLQFPEGSAEPVTFRHDGDSNRATLRVYWPVPDGTNPIRTRRLSILRNVFRNRMVSVIREEEAATYSPGVGMYTKRQFEDFGYIFVNMDIVPEKIPAMTKKIHEVAADFQAKNISEDEFDRAIKPVIESLDSSLESNKYWMSVLGNAQTDSWGIDNFRTREATYESMTLADIKPFAAQIFKPEKSVLVEILPKSVE